MSRRAALRAKWAIWGESLRGSLFAIPSAILAVSIGAAAVTLILDRRIGPALRATSWFFDVGAEGTRATLGAIAGSVLTVAGVAFSITIVVLQLASTQYSPRVIRSFRRDRLIQIVLGVYTGTFMYSLLVLRAISAAEREPDFTAPISVSLAILLGILCMVLLIALVHHVARTVQVSTIVGTVADETRATMKRLHPERLGDDDAEDHGPDESAPPTGTGPAWILRARRDGYLDYVDAAAVEAIEGATLVRIERTVGDFVREGEPLASIWPESARELDANADLASALAIGAERTMQQDVRFGVRMIVDVALRALSPGINDPATAVHCVHVLGGLLRTLAARRFPSPLRRTERGMRIHAPRPSFDEILCLSFGEILAAARSAPPVQVAIAEALGAIADRVSGPSPTCAARREELARFAAGVVRASAGCELDARQRAWIEAVRALAGSAPAAPPSRLGPDARRSH